MVVMLVLDLGAHDGELRDKGVDDLLLQLLVVGQRVPRR